MLPFIAGALRRHLEEFPSIDGGLSRTERQALSILAERGSLSLGQLCVAVSRQEEAVFMGDVSFYRIMTDLSKVRHPLVQISGKSQQEPGDVAITETGRRVLEGKADHVALNGIDRWLGGAHLTGDKTVWRWDRMSGRLTANHR